MATFQDWLREALAQRAAQQNSDHTHIHIGEPKAFNSLNEMFAEIRKNLVGQSIRNDAETTVYMTSGDVRDYSGYWHIVKDSYWPNCLCLANLETAETVLIPWDKIDRVEANDAATD